MPRNPHKTRCQVPGCRSWAMRGHTRCRSHRDAELGPRGAGAPHYNLNALKHACYSRPLPLSDLQDLAIQILQEPDDLPLHIGLVLHTLQARARDPLKTLLALRCILSHLISWVAHHQFKAELHALLHDLPPPQRHPLQALIIQRVSHLSPENRLLFLRKIKKCQKQLTEPGNTRRDIPQPNT